MKKIRKCVFETNSSSTHSVSISEDLDFSQTIEPNSKGIIKIKYGQYGWEVAKYLDSIDKASYALTYSQYFDEEKNIEMLKKVIKEHTGAKEVKIIKIEDEDNIDREKGYIDHQSCEKPAEFFESEEKLKKFLFNSKSFFITDNDND